MCQKCAAQLGLCQLVYAPPIDTEEEESDSDNDHDESNNKMRRRRRNNAAKTSEMKTKKSAGNPLIPIAHIVQENQSNQEEDINL
eukprot:14716671-Ditylum_brightwellii.AAC.1